MIRFLHAADPHIDSPLRGLDAHEGAPVQLLRGATRRAFENLVQLAIDERVDFVVIAGDLYDGDWRDYRTGLFLRGEMARLNRAGIPVYLVAGNHDAASVIHKKVSLPDNVHLFSTRTAETIEVTGHPVVIHGRGFAHRAVPENLAAEYPAAVPGKCNIGVLHTSLAGRSGHDTYAPCTEADLGRKGYAYWALGHVHQPEILCRDPWIVYAGNCQGRDVRETGPRGCRLVTLSSALEVQSVRWHELAVVRWEVITVNLDGVAHESEALGRVRDALAGVVGAAGGRLVAARIVFTGATCLHGSLHRESSRWRAELLGCAQDQGDDAVWIEKVLMQTSSVRDPEQLGRRDALTGIVLETLRQAGREPVDFPREIRDMLDVVPAEVRNEVASEWTGERQTGAMQEVRDIILDALGTTGGEET